MSFEVVPEDLLGLADRSVDWCIELASGVADSAGSLSISARDAGNTENGPATISEHGLCVEAAQEALEYMSEVFAASADSLMLCAFAFSNLDEIAAESLGGSGTTLPTGPVPTPPESSE